jgi:tol-pal system protein YbgF
VRKITSGAWLVVLLGLPLTLGSAGQTKKIYELIYDDLQALKQQVQKLQARLDQNAEDVRLAQEQLRELADLIRRSLAEQTGLREDVKAVPAQYQFVSERLDQLSLQLARIAADLAAGRGGPPAAAPPGEGPPATPPVAEAEKKPGDAAVAPVTPPAGGNLSPQDAYNASYNDYLKGNYDLAVDGFRLYREQFPDSPLADNALYWIGECYYSQKKFEEAIGQFNDLILAYPQGDKVPAAYLKKGFAYVEIGKTEEAAAAFKLLAAKFPLAEETRLARDKLKELEQR